MSRQGAKLRAAEKEAARAEEFIHANHHDNHHRLIAERFKVWQNVSKRERIRRREAGKKAVWTLVGHLRFCHSWRGNSALMSYNELKEVHDGFH